MKKAMLVWLKGMNVNVAAITLAAFTFAASILGFGLMVRAEISALRAEIRADNATMRADNAAFRSEVRSDMAAMRADNDAFKDDMRYDFATFKAEVRADIAEMRADNAAIRADLKEIADALDVRLSAIELEQARMLGVISVLESQAAAKGSP